MAPIMRFDAIAAAVDLTLCLVFALAVWAPLGGWILSKLGGSPFRPALSISIAFGMGFWGIWILFLGTAGLLFRGIVIASALTIAIACRAHFPVRKPAPDKRALLLFGVFALAALGHFLVVFTSALAPETSFDALNVHLPYARDAALAREIRFASNNWSSAMPALPLMSYITAFLLSGTTLARFFNALCYFLCGGVVFSFAARWWGNLRGIAAALLFWSCPIAVYEATTAMIDLPLALFSAIAVFSCLEWARSRDRSWLWISAAGLGLALSCKYHAAFWLLPILLVIARMAAPPQKQIFKFQWWQAPIKGHQVVGLWFGYLALTGIVALPWFVRTWAYTGNPVFPVANSIFKSPWFTPAMEAAANAMYANEGVGRSAGALLRLPFTVTFHPGPFRGTLGAILSLGTLLAALRCASRTFRKNDRGLPVCYGLVFTFFFFSAWALTAQEIRYLLPLAPLLGAVSAIGLLGHEEERSWILCTGSVVLLAGAIVAYPAVYPSVVSEWTYWHSYQSPAAYLRGAQTAEEYMRRDIPSIYVYEYIGKNLEPKDRVLLLNDAYQFYSSVPTLYSFTVEGEGILLEQTEAGVMEKMKRARITHVLLNYNGLAPLPGVVPRQGAYFFLDKDFQEKHLKPLYSNNKVTLFAVTRQERDL
jgi:hypothetical protein